MATCPVCKTKHSVDPGGIPPQAQRVRCSTCAATFLLRALEEDKQQGSGRPRRISVVVSKGGVGKTTTAVNLAAGLACNGRKTLLIDADTQGQDSLHLGVHPKKGLADFIVGNPQAEDALFEARPNLWLLAGGRNLGSLKRFIHKQDFGGEYTLKNRLQSFENQFSFIIIDTAPGWDSLTINVLFYADEIAIPVSMEMLALHGLTEFSKSLEAIKAYRNALEIKYIIPTFYDTRMQESEAVLGRLKNFYGEKVLPPIRNDHTLAQAPALGLCIFEFAPGSSGAKDYRQLIASILC
jgi:chromosome partitioning protein